MDSRSFAIGLICGVAIGVLAVWLFSGNGEDDAHSGAEHEVSLTSIPAPATVAPPAEQESQELPRESVPKGSDPQVSIETTLDPATPWPDNLRAELEAEAKDESWAYYMEQTLLQYLSTHPLIDRFDISSIECRTTRCQIEVFGFDESTVPVWNQVMFDIRQQPWSEFIHYGYSSGNVEGRVTIIGTLHRESEPE